MRIIRVPIAPLHMINAFIITTEENAIIVDTGLPGMAGKFLAALQQDGKSWQNVKLIVVTHAHVDHAGSAARLQQLTRAPVLGHRGDRPYFLQERKMHYCSTGFSGRLLKATGMAQSPFDGFEPDIELEDHDRFSLKEFGVDGHVQYTPGHTEGSISVILSRGDALVSDLLASGLLLGGIAWMGRPKRPPFEDNPHLVADQLEALVQQGSRHFHIGHGAMLGPEQVTRHIARLRRL